MKWRCPMDFDNFDEFILQKILFHLMNVNIRSFAELNTKTPEFLLMYEEINEYFNLKGFPLCGLDLSRIYENDLMT